MQIHQKQEIKNFYGTGVLFFLFIYIEKNKNYAFKCFIFKENVTKELLIIAEMRNIY